MPTPKWRRPRPSALGRIGDAAATKTLEQALTAAPAAVRSAVAEGCILCAERLLAEGKTTEAADLYDKVRQADVPKQRMLEATRGAILARGSAGVPLLVEQLQSADRGAVCHRVIDCPRAGRPGSGQGTAWPSWAGRRRIGRPCLILALADRGDTEALPAMLQAAQSGPNQVRIAAIGMLKRLGNASCVPTLLEIAVAADEQVAQAAVAALEELPGEGVNADLAARWRRPKARCVSC